MKKVKFWSSTLWVFGFLVLASCSPPSEESSNNVNRENSGGAVNSDSKPASKAETPEKPCHYNGHPLHVGPKGGCYYFYDGRKKEYVDHSFCKDCEKVK